MGDNLGPFGLSLGCKVIYSKNYIGLTRSWHGPLLLGPRFRRQPRAPRRAPSGFGGGLRKRGQATDSHAKNAEKRVLHQSTDVVPETWVTGFGPNGLSRGLQGLLLQVEISEIVSAPPAL